MFLERSVKLIINHFLAWNFGFETQNLILDIRDLILKSFKNRVLRIKTWVTQNIILSGVL